MSVRCNIILADDYHRLQLYRHMGGHPEGEYGVLSALEKALPFAWPLPRFEPGEFAAALVRAWKNQCGYIYIDGSPEGWEMIHSDVQWVYVVKPTKPADEILRALTSPKGKTAKLEFQEPMVEVYNWWPYCNGADPEVATPNPALIVPLSQAYDEGMNWFKTNHRGD